MTQNTDLINKRIAAVHKASLAKAMHHMGKTAGFHKSLMGHLEKAAAACMGTGKAAGDLQADIGQHIVEAHKAAQEAMDHHELSQFHLSKMSDAWGVSSTTAELPIETGGSIAEPGQDALTEGRVPGMDAIEPYPGKAAAALAAAGYVTKGEVEAREKAARLEGELAGQKALSEALGKMPAGGPRARLFAVDKSAFTLGDGAPADANPVEKIMKGVHLDPDDPNSAKDACSRMIGNMIADTFSGGKTFAKSVFDPNFRGGAGGRVARIN